MRITQTGTYRRAGTWTLVTADLTQAKVADQRRLRFSSEKQVVAFIACGTSDKPSDRATYTYEVTLTPAEVLLLVDLMVREVAEDTASRAIGRGAVTSLRELLVPKPTA